MPQATMRTPAPGRGASPPPRQPQPHQILPRIPSVDGHAGQRAAIAVLALALDHNWPAGEQGLQGIAAAEG